MTVAEFILENYPHYRTWDRDRFNAWLAWHIHNGFGLIARQDDNSIVGAALIRPVMKPEDAIDYYEYDPEGSVLFVDVAVCTHPSAMQALAHGVLQRFGMRNTIAWRREPYRVIKCRSAHWLRNHIFRKMRV